MCTHTKRYLQLRDGVIQITFKILWQKNGENNQKVGKIGRVVNQALAFKPKHDKIWAWWVLDILSPWISYLLHKDPNPLQNLCTINIQMIPNLIVESLLCHMLVGCTMTFIVSWLARWLDKVCILCCIHLYSPCKDPLIQVLLLSITFPSCLGPTIHLCHISDAKGKKCFKTPP